MTRDTLSILIRTKRRPFPPTFIFTNREVPEPPVQDLVPEVNEVDENELSAQWEFNSYKPQHSAHTASAGQPCRLEREVGGPMWSPVGYEDSPLPRGGSASHGAKNKTVEHVRFYFE